jgi:hypothetical protein
MSSISKDFIVKHGLVVSTTATVQSMAISTSPTTGALVVTGGLGIGGTANFGATVCIQGVTNIQSTAVSTSSTTGALVVSGGMGVSGCVFISGQINLSGIVFNQLPYSYNNVSLCSCGIGSLYNAVSTGSIVFGDGTVQATRGPISWSNQSLAAAALQVYGCASPCTIVGLTIHAAQGGIMVLGDTYFDDGSLFGNPPQLWLMADQGFGNVSRLAIPI